MKDVRTPATAQRIIASTLAIVFGLCFLLATEHRAYAYIDPGSGLLALQSAGAAIAAAGYFMRRRIAAIFGKKPVAEETATNVQPIQAATAVPKTNTRSAA